MTRFRTRQDSLSSHSSPSSSSDIGSPSPRQRSRAFHTLAAKTQVPRRVPMDRMASTSSATLFFGPAIPHTSQDLAKNRRSLADTQGDSFKAGFLEQPTSETQSPTFSRNHRPGLPARHSYAGSGTFQSWLGSPSQSPQKPNRSMTEGSMPTAKQGADVGESSFFAGDHSFSFSFDSPNKLGRRISLPSKYQDRAEDSGVVLSDDEHGLGILENRRQSIRSTVPSASTSVSTIQTQSSGGEDIFASGFVTPLDPHPRSGWPVVVGIASDDDEVDDRSTASRDSQVVDEFIMKALVSGAKVTEPKKAPGTPTKKTKTFIGAKRPWQSAVAQKIGLKGFGDDADDKGKTAKKKVPRKSMPAKLSMHLHSKEKSRVSDDEDEEEDELSPSSHKTGMNLYTGLGLGRPSGVKPRQSNPSQSSIGSVAGRAKWLMRRSSSGAFSFSSGSDTASSAGTPVGTKGQSKWSLALWRDLTQARS
jgi:mitosis inhibitor protein kinase SWE1